MADQHAPDARNVGLLSDMRMFDEESRALHPRADAMGTLRRFLRCRHPWPILRRWNPYLGAVCAGGVSTSGGRGFGFATGPGAGRISIGGGNGATC